VTGYLRLRGAAEPDDVASETFLAVFRNLASFEGDEGQFRSWVFTIAHRRLLDEHRRTARRPVTTELEDAGEGPAVDGPEDSVLGALEYQRLSELLEELSPAQRDVVLLRVVAGLSLEETAIVIGRRVGAVKQLQRRGLLRLQEELSSQRVTQ
jgi:RNA polymerase sigma-70 factor (ECF subfamily)